MPRAGFEPTIPATKRPQTYALDRAATWIDFHNALQNITGPLTKDEILFHEP
jgi:hypothetical protein